MPNSPNHSKTEIAKFFGNLSRSRLLTSVAEAAVATTKIARYICDNSRPSATKRLLQCFYPSRLDSPRNQAVVFAMKIMRSSPPQFSPISLCLWMLWHCLFVEAGNTANHVLLRLLSGLNLPALHVMQQD